ncbi:hypothetical protein QTG56_25070 (plasmid) [Rossellomorea sp. AcN35-11]|nr:hypothetical protein [Rossellomorea aquimaris]WJV31906.1 hypothetical protein QTG56_25070 [Rossellomorea sp. AcN35-11]
MKTTKTEKAYKGSMKNLFFTITAPATVLVFAAHYELYLMIVFIPFFMYMVYEDYKDFTEARRKWLAYKERTP